MLYLQIQAMDAVLRAVSTRSFRGYEKLTEEDLSAGSPRSLNMPAWLDRARSVPVGDVLKGPHKSTSSNHEKKPPAKAVAKQAKKSSKVHPLFNLFDGRSRKKAAAKPEFSRYLQYLREGGMWELNADKPAIY